MMGFPPSAPKVGAQVWTGSPTTAELMASFPFDFVYLDTEHTPYDSSETVAGLARAIQSRGNAVWARARENHPQAIGRLLELGVEGIAVPHVNTAEDAERAVAAAQFPPYGQRGFCPNVRRYDYGRLRVADVEEAHPPQIFAMIEDFAAIPRLEEILSTDIAGVFPGLADMSWTAEDPEVRGNWAHPLLQETFAGIVDAATRNGKQVMAAVGYLAKPGENLASVVTGWHAKGVDVFTLSSDITVIENWCRSMIESLGRS